MEIYAQFHCSILASPQTFFFSFRQCDSATHPFALAVNKSPPGIFPYGCSTISIKRKFRDGEQAKGVFTWHRATFAPRRVHSGSLSWLYICLHDTTTKSHAGASRPGVSSLRLSHQGENFTPVRNLATVSCKHETTTRVGVKSVCR